MARCSILANYNAGYPDPLQRVYSAEKLENWMLAIIGRIKILITNVAHFWPLNH